MALPEWNQNGNSTQASAALTSAVIYICAIDFPGLGYGVNEIDFVSLGLGLTAQEAADQHAIRQAWAASFA